MCTSWPALFHHLVLLTAADFVCSISHCCETSNFCKQHFRIHPADMCECIWILSSFHPGLLNSARMSLRMLLISTFHQHHFNGSINFLSFIYKWVACVTFSTEHSPLPWWKLSVSLTQTRNECEEGKKTEIKFKDNTKGVAEKNFV